MKRMSVLSVVVGMIVFGTILVGLAVAGPSLRRGLEFTNATVEGTYIFGFSGTVLNNAPGMPGPPGAPGPIAGNGLIILDGRGNLQGSETLNDAGFACTGTLSGTYNVNSDGTATATVNFTNRPSSPCTDAVVHEAITISEAGKLVNFIGTDADTVFSGTQELQ